MATATLIASLLVAAVALASGLWGAWLWWRFSAQNRYWIAIRATQVGALLLALLAGIAWVTGDKPDSWLFWLYSLLPISISLVAEQLRIVAAEQVLDRRGLADADAVAQLDDVGQRAVVREIIRREIGLMTVATLVISFLALRVMVERGGL